MRVLVTGGSGFLGRRVVPALVARGHDVFGLARSAAAAEVVRLLGGAPVMGDLDDRDAIHAAFRAAPADVLVNLASLGFGHADTVVTAAETHGPRRAVFISTTAIFTRLAAASKAVRVAAEERIRTSSLDWTVLRPTMIYGGPDDRNISRLLRLIQRFPAVPVPGGGHRLQQPVHVEDLAAAVCAAAERPESIGRCYDVGGPDPMSFRQLIADSGAAVHRRVVAIPVPLAPAIAAVRLYERMSRRPRVKAEQIERLAEDKAFDISAATADLGFRPRSFAVGIAEEAARL